MKQDCYTLKAGDVEISEAPEVITLLPLGHVTSSKGAFFVDEESLREMKRQIAKRGVDVVVDYEHQTLKGVQAPAAGWLKELYLKDGSIKARIEWTQAAAQYLKNKEYRYISPVIAVRKTDGKVTDLHSLALTNTPAIEGMDPLVNSQQFEPTENKGGQHKMDLLKKLAQLLGLPEDAAEEDVTEALKTCMNENKTLKEASGTEKQEKQTAENEPDDKIVANKAVCELLGLKAGSPAADVSAKIMELKNGTIDGVNILEELKALKHLNEERAAGEAVTLALKSGKITPAQADWAKGYALSDPKGFGAFVEKAPQVVPMGTIASGSVKALKGSTIDETAMFICKQLGISKEDIEKYGKE